MTETTANNNDAPAAPAQGATRAGSEAPGSADDQRRLETLASENPAAANLARVLMSAGHSTVSAIAMVTAAIVPPPLLAPPTGANDGQSAMQKSGPTTPRRKAADTDVIRGGSVPPSDPPVPGKRTRTETPTRSPAKRHKATEASIATGQADDEEEFDPSPAYLNPHEFDELWPADRIVAKVKKLEYVGMWFFTPVGCKQAEEQRMDGTEDTVMVRSNGMLKAAGTTKAPIADENLSPHQFAAATSLWLKVARKVKVPNKIICEMIVLNSEIIGHDHWSTDPTTLMMWHSHQRRTWSRYMANPQGETPFKLHALNPATQPKPPFVPSPPSVSPRLPSTATRFFVRPGEPAPPSTFEAQQVRADLLPAPSPPACDAAPQPHRTTESIAAFLPSARTALSPSSRTIPAGRTAFASRTLAKGSAFPSTSAAATAAAETTLIDARGVAAAHTATRTVHARPAAVEQTLGPTPLRANGWRAALRKWMLDGRYPTIVAGIEHGFKIGLPHITSTFVPPNHNSATKDSATVLSKIAKEQAAGRYTGPFSRAECEAAVGGPFQCSPIALAPKPPDGWRFIQDASFPRYDPFVRSINAQVDSDEWPCTYSGISMAIWQIIRLPPTAQAAARDVRSAYRAILLHPSQWPAAVVQWDGKFYVDKALAFGMSSSAGAWGVVGDALADVLRAEGIGPILKWVDDYLFFRVPSSAVPEVNACRSALAARVRPGQRGGCLFWRDGEHDLSEDFTRPIRDLAASPSEWAYSFKEVDAICDPLGVPWSEEKEQPFGPVVTYYGIVFNIPARTMALPERKRVALRANIDSWLATRSHTRSEAESLLGQLQFATHVVPSGRPYLSGLVQFLGMHAAAASRRRGPARENVFDSAPLHPPARVRLDLLWWHLVLDCLVVSRSFENDLELYDPGLYTDACGSGAGVVLDGKVAAYAFSPNWRAGGRDIMWAEAVGAELGLLHLVAGGARDRRLRLYNDNTAVEAGLRHGRVRNEAANECLERLFRFAYRHNLDLVPARVSSGENPADGPSRGAVSLLPRLPSVVLPSELAGVLHRLW
ncbi:hypothetical protein A4X13_0g8119 [Tilletia indica]|uniref:Reverse transcriptase domain-containing protein n=1 Tax=Tilletia indica TaxID=43049 RepID=A0A177TAL8_9BASI|nr:hypothetical protein A4X13_0g8119 [Tilletia indica]